MNYLMESNLNNIEVVVQMVLFKEIYHIFLTDQKENLKILKIWHHHQQ